MKLISHRGNINGRVEDRENHPAYIDEAIELGYDVEVDIWYHQHTFWLGHDEPTYKIDFNWLTDRCLNLWVHCKDLATISIIKDSQSDLVELNYFYHNVDDCTLTSKNDIWVYPGKQPVQNSIAVLPEIFNDDLSTCTGICSDNIKSHGSKNENFN